MQSRKTKKTQGWRKQEVGVRAKRLDVAGIDVGAEMMHVCGPVRADGKAEVRTYSTATGSIRECVKWLQESHVKSVAMESTGVYWVPVVEVMEAMGLECLLTDSRGISKSGKKTDVVDCQRIQQLHSCGLLASCFRPSEEIQQMRNMVRLKVALEEEQADFVRRMQKELDQMNVRVHHAVTDIQGVTGMAIIRAIVKGERDGRKLAQLRQSGCHNNEAQIAEYLTGSWRNDHLFNLKHCLEVYDQLGAHIAEYNAEIANSMRHLTPESRQGMEPAKLGRDKMKAITRRNEQERRKALYQMVGVDLTSIDGIGVETAEAIVSEYGYNLSQFENEKAFAAHLRLTPYRPVTGGKAIKSKKRPRGMTRAGAALRHAANSLRRSKSALGAYFRRISRHKDSPVAIFATARKLAHIVYRMLRYGKAYVDEGQQAYEARFQSNTLRRLASTAQQHGFKLVPISEPQVVDSAWGLR